MKFLSDQTPFSIRNQLVGNYINDSKITYEKSETGNQRAGYNVNRQDIIIVPFIGKDIFDRPS